ncbi:Mu transposase C-terminal domain-containing protein [Azospira restricta]|uniref:DDE-type integrase/transposase/recombinase n=1 Tax=Azospira restricta TaxID=404405 RepID=A0A974SQC7_9RHOO|nr:Mu transposase C-terminal domain-containing protein [Azospira restricta]QRJ64423.1 DDE-type integrase/transposase/recombinase [Azospira restricta]
MNQHNDPEVLREAFEPIRCAVDVQLGCLVQSGGKVYRISQVLDFESALGIDVESGRVTPLRIAELRPLDNALPPAAVDLSEIADEDWIIAERRFAAIKPLVTVLAPGRYEVEQRAGEVGVDASTLYRWLQRYRAYGDVSALIPKKRGWKAGNTRISPSAEEVIREVINDYYLTQQRPTPQKVIVEVKRRCEERGIVLPSPSTIRARIASIPERAHLRGRGFREKAKNKFLPAAGSFPNADYPLAVVQIDHTPADIILVDDVYRKPIGRPWITLAMDIYSRMVTGYYLSFDPPSETSVAMCVAHSMLPKDEWLLLHKVQADWPVWGRPRTIHVDNGADFRSNNFQRSCLAYGIHLEFRPVRQPRYGGHIERMLGTFLKEIHDLPGTTFSSIKDKEGYDSEKHAAMTKSEFEEWLVTLICKVYHQRLHAGIGMAPRKRWENGIFGEGGTPGVGLPPRPADRLTILLDFLPAFRRTVQTFGVTIDGMTYYAEALRPWINAQDPDDRKKKREFIFRRDPRDVSAIWFRDPDINQYFKIPFADQSLPSISIWELQAAKEQLKKEGAKSVDERQILRAVTELRSKVEEAQEKTKKARRQAQRRKEHEKRISPASPLSPPAAKPREPLPAMSSQLVDGDIDAFGDIA